MQHKYCCLALLFAASFTVSRRVADSKHVHATFAVKCCIYAAWWEQIERGIVWPHIRRHRYEIGTEKVNRHHAAAFVVT